MKLFSFFKKDQDLQDDAPVQEPVEDTTEADELAEEPLQEEEVALGTKIKVVAALAVVGLATGVAYWVQEPTDVRVDVLSSDEVAEEVPADTTIEVAEPVELAEETLVAANAEVLEVSIVDFTYTPANLTVEPGTTVIWTNMDAVAHTVTSDFFTSDTLNSGDSYVYTFDQEGEYEYFCSIHPQMAGKVTVSEAGAAAEESAEELLPEDATTEESVSPALLTLDDTLSPAADEPEIVTLDAAELLEEEPLAEDDTLILSVPEETPVHTAAVSEESGQELSKSGPEDILYVALFFGILYFTRRKRIETSG